MNDPFAVLGLPARPDLSDERVRTAWRTVAAATHPDRPGGGNPAAYAAASAAYAALRTPWGRSEACADLDRIRPAVRLPHGPRGLRPARHQDGRCTSAGPGPYSPRPPLRLALRVLTALVLAMVAAQSGAGGPAAAGVAAGLAVWVVLSGRGDLAAPPGR